MSRKSETDEDISNVEAWAEVIEDLLHSVPPQLRTEVLALVATKEEADRKEREKHNGLKFITWEDLEALGTSPAARHWNAIMRLKSLVVQVFVRDITNDHSKKDAADILFVEHRHGTGSGWLPDYIGDLMPMIHRRRRQLSEQVPTIRRP
jgi:hypothetical protein